MDGWAGGRAEGGVRCYCYMLLHWEGLKTRPSGKVTGGKGLPVDTTARPSVHR